MGSIERTHAGLADSTVQELQKGLGGSLLRPADAAYDAARRVFNGMTDRRPEIIVRCAGAADAVRSVDFARTNQLPLAIRGGGHGVAGNAVCDGGLVIDFSGLRHVEVDVQRRTARAQPGVTWHDFDAKTQAHGLATTGGLVSTTGIAGFTLGGGFGWLVRKHGLACDNLIEADVVMAEGELVRASSSENPDLFWALRGGGGNFGVVTSFTFQLHPLRQIVGGLVAHPRGRAPEVLRFYREYVRSVPDELTSMAALAMSPDGVPIIALAACYAGPVNRAEEVIRPLREFGPPVLDHIGPIPYVALQTMFDPGAPAGMQNYWKSDFLQELSDGAIDTITAHAGRMASPMSQVHIHHLGGAMNRIGLGASAFSRRDANFLYNIIGLWPDPSENQRHISWARDFFTAMKPWGVGGAYINFMGEESQDRVRAAYGPNYERLIALKSKYDPNNLFRLNQNIGPAAT